jgi:hypothetical protein
MRRRRNVCPDASEPLRFPLRGGHGVAVAQEELAGGGGAEESEKVAGGGVGFAAASEDGDLIERGVMIAGNFNPLAAIFEIGSEDEREGDEAGVGVAGLDELGGLRDVFADDDLGPRFGPEAEFFEGLARGAAVGSGVGVGDGDFANGRGAEDGGEIFEDEVGFGGPEHEAADGEGRERRCGGVAGGDEGLRIVDVGGEEDIEGRAVADLRDKAARGAGNGGDGGVGGGFFEGGDDVGEDVDEIGGGGDGYLRGIGGGDGSESCEKP